jgi:hypothetical protein
MVPHSFAKGIEGSQIHKYEGSARGPELEKGAEAPEIGEGFGTSLVAGTRGSVVARDLWTSQFSGTPALAQRLH